MNDVRDQQPLSVAIIGSGFSGLCLGAMLRREGIDDFVILEKADDVGGTWRDNSYPGAACDIPSHLYSFSFEPKSDWSRVYPPQPEILEYLRHCARKFGLVPHLRFGREVTAARFDEGQGVWTVETASGETFRARAIALGNGGLHIPSYPNIPGLASFEGKTFHSARWDHSYDLTGKTVAVIGTGASAIQFVPQIQPLVKKLYLFQRTPPWIVPKPDRPITDREKWVFSNVPLARWAHRAKIYWTNELKGSGFTVDPRIFQWAERLVLRYIHSQVKDPALRQKLTPNYRMGCKRILLSNDYYPALTQPNVEVVTDGIAEATQDGIRTKDGALREVDAILFGTGFNASGYLSKIAIYGLGGREVNACWHDKPGTYYGVTASGFPNLFLLMGPNTGLGHNSMVFMIEAQSRYALQCIKAMRQRHIAWMDVRADVQDAYYNALQDRLKDTVWSSGCVSWYQDDAGHNLALWPGTTFEYWWRTRTVNLDHYDLHRAWSSPAA